jgi:protein gp37
MRSGWWDQTWNPVAGCDPPKSPGCTNCYAAKLAVAYAQYGHSRPDIRALHPGIADKVHGKAVFNGKLSTTRRGHELWTWPLRWRGADHPLLGDGMPSLIWAVGVGDLFVGGRSINDINRVCAVLALSDHIGLLLTKYTAQMAAFFSTLDPRTVRVWMPKLWLGFSAERQKEFDQRWADMRPLAGAGWFTFVSVAPMLAPVVLPNDFLSLGRWVIVSGEQGAHRDCRPMDPRWARAIRDQCRRAGIPLFVKQMSRKAPIPPDLLIREFPRLE